MKPNERFVSQNPEELMWLRINRLRSVKLCESLLYKKCEHKGIDIIDKNLMSKKAIGLSSAIESAIGYWNQKPENLNSRILSRYYALLQMTIAEQVSSVNNNDDLSTIQKHTEYGHGLATITDNTGEFPFNYYVLLSKSGHFHAYTRFLGYDASKIEFEKRPRKFKDVIEPNKLIPLIDLFRRIPELQPVLDEYLGVNPLSFQVIYSDTNRILESKRRQEYIERTGRFVFDLPEPEDVEKITFVSILPASDSQTLDYFSNLPLPFFDLEEKTAIASDEKIFDGKFKHKNEGYWHQYLPLYRTSYCGTSYVVPIFNIIDDAILINLMLMYCLSIIVRYLPDLWYKIHSGELDHIGSLIEYYLSIFDHVIPLQMLERITETEISIISPDRII